MNEHEHEHDHDQEKNPPVIIKKREGLSAVWLVPIIALIFGIWLVVKAVNERGTYITVQFDNASGVVVGKTQVRYKGLVTGVVSNVEIAEDLQSVILEIEMVAGSSAMLTDKTLFWYVTADISFQGITGLDTLLSGSYINIQPDVKAEGESKRHFVALEKEPTLDSSTPGLHLVLQTDSLGSLGKKSPVTFKQITVGYVSGFKYAQSASAVEVNVFIEPQYAHLVKDNSRFWNASGFEFSGSITSGVEVKTESLASIIAGGIAFDDASYQPSSDPAKNGQEYPLFASFQDAQMGHSIELVLDLNSNIDIGAAIRYQGLTLGKVDAFSEIDPLKGQIVAQAKVNPRVIPYLTEQTQFFVVSPTIDLGGVTNMHTLLTGSFIGVVPSLKGPATTKYTVYRQKPAYQYAEPGLHLVLSATDISSLKVGGAIFYQQQHVGSIQALENITPDEALVHIHIEEAYQDYVTGESRFWNASGLRITGGLQGVEIQASSLQSILSGGIVFDRDKSSQLAPPDNGDKFVLFANQDIAKERIAFTLKIASAKGLSNKTRLMLRGEKIGSVHQIKRDQDGVTLQVGILPDFAHVLHEDSQFWLVKPNISLAGLSDTEAIFGGAYIGLNVGKGKPDNLFWVAQQAPAKLPSSEGLQLILNSAHGNLVTAGNAVSYRGIVVGQVDNASLAKSGEQVTMHITLDEKYRHLITQYTRFYNASGVNISGVLGNFKVNTETVDSILKGGVSFYNPQDVSGGLSVSENEHYSLFANQEHAQMAGTAISIHFNDVSGLKAGMPVKHQEQKMGVIERIKFDQQGYGATALVFLNDNGKKFAVKNTKFWLAKPVLGFVGSKNVSALFDGGFINVFPGKGEPSSQFDAYDRAPPITELTYGLNLVLTANSLGSVRVGDPVLYRQVSVGEVIGVDLADTANKVNIYINIARRYAPLVTSQSKFWNSSGFTLNAGVFSGVKIEAESFESILSGGIAFATPNSSNTQAQQGQGFILADQVNEEWRSWQPGIELGQ